MDGIHILWLFFIILKFITGERILAIFPNPAVSHFYAFEPYLVELTNRGHHVVVVSYFPQKYKIQNYTDINFQLENTVGLNIGENEHLKFRYIFELTHALLDVTEIQDAKVLEYTLQTLGDKYEFDLVLTEIFNTELFIGFGYKYNVPVIGLCSGLLMPWTTSIFGIPDNPSYIPVLLSTSTDKMTFQQRLTNTIYYLVFNVLKNKYSIKSDKRARKYFGEQMPSLGDLSKKASLILVNTHHSISVVRPLPPQVVEVAGIHLKPAKPLPKDIEEFINQSKHGVIYFSFGSLVKSSTMKEITLRAFCDVFSQLPHRVLWKWEKPEMTGKPDNVKIVQWAPQRDILAHPNIKLFISHGGLLGTIEAVGSGVPILGIPFYGDQMQNVQNLVEKGVAYKLDFLNISQESLSHAMKLLLYDKNYAENAHRLSEIFKDRPHPPLETAVYWTEYVLRHKGAHHLRTAAVDLPWYQYLLLDVIVALLCLSIVTSFIIFYIVKLVFRKIYVHNSKCKEQ